MTPRRALLQGIFRGMVATLVATVRPLPAQNSSTVRPLFEQDLTGPFQGWVVTAAEVSYPPGVTSARHKHSGFVLGYVLEGPYRFQVDGGQEMVLQTGQVFHEPLGAIHAVSGAATATRPARILAVVVGEKGKPTTSPA
jgi:quercetin dioxygenase-like cupin family protein